MCSTMEENLTSDLSDDVEGQIRAFIGKATLLTSKKFKQFKVRETKEEEGEDVDSFNLKLYGLSRLKCVRIPPLS